MMPVPVTALYAALLALVGVTLQQLVGWKRLHAEVSLLDGGNPGLREAMRRQANFVEQVPFAVLLFALIELNGAPAWWLHTLGATLLAARIVHPFGIRDDVMRVPARGIGALVTLLVVLAACGTALWQVLQP